MKSIIETIKQQKKLVLMLPFLVVPILAAIFWAFGGGKGTAMMTKDEEKAGLNPDLPKAHFNNDEEAWNKLSLYEKAKRDSLRFNEAKRNDPYFRLDLLEVRNDTNTNDNEVGSINASLGKNNHDLDANEKMLRNRLKTLERGINSIEEPTAFEARNSTNVESIQGIDEDVERLESMMGMMQGNGSGDPEMQQINDVLGKILDIQHPERVKERTKELDRQRVSYQVTPSHGQDVVNVIQNDQVAPSTDSVEFTIIELNGFHGLDGDFSNDEPDNAIAAMVYNDQTLVNGSFVKLILQQDVKVKDKVIPRNAFAVGVCSLNGERLMIEVNSLRKDNSIYPVSLTAYDLDGIEGIYVPGAMARDAAKQTSDQTLQSLQLNTLDPSLEVQAATAGLEVTKGLLTKKSKMIRVLVKAGHNVLLKGKNDTQ